MWVAVVLTTVACLLPAGASAAALEVLGTGQEPLQTITLNTDAQGRLTGTLLLAVRNNTSQTQLVSAHYFPRGSERIASPGVLVPGPASPPIARAHQTVEVELVALLPAKASPSDLGGIVILQLKPAKGSVRPVKKGAGSKPVQAPEPVGVPVQAAGPALSGVSIVPANLTIHAISWWGPLSEPGAASATVQLRGPGLSALFSHASTVTTGVLLRSDTGHDVFAKLTASAPRIGRNVSNATVSVNGTLSPGSYSAKLPLTDLTTGGPALELKVAASHSVLWALLAVLLGAFAGGGIYLASNLKRRKDLLEASVRESLEAYLATRAELTKSGGLSPLWKIRGLGEQSNWYVRRWSALSDTAGVQGTWSKIYFARNDADLDAVEKSVSTLHDRVVRWLKFAREGDIQALVAASELKPRDPQDKVWSNTKTCKETERLRRELQEIEPADDATADDLRERAIRQARWHAALALAWHMRSVVGKEVDERDDHDGREKLEEIDLIDIDKRSSSKPDRTAEEQLQLEIELDTWTAKLNKLYKGPPEDIQLPGPQEAVILGGLSATEARLAQDTTVNIPRVATPAPTSGIEPEPTGPSHAVVKDWFEANPGWLRALVLRDYGWSLVVVVVTTAAYVPARYSSTWGSLGDYATAFGAGFLGKAAINWGILPVFTSLSLKAKQPDADADKKTQTKTPNGKKDPPDQKTAKPGAPEGPSAAHHVAPAGASPAS